MPLLAPRRHASSPLEPPGGPGATRSFAGLPRSVPVSVASLGALLVASCGPGEPAGPGTDAGPEASVVRCTRDADCMRTFCAGTARCIVGAAEADARGCVLVRAACQTGEICDESMARCVRTCSVRDADGDGFDAIECGGTDCDDANGRRYPGATEVCDVDDVDEDCDPATFGFRDADGDGFADAACCNVGPDGVRACGTDCDDVRAAVHPGVPDTCNGIDEDCDGIVDEDGASVTVYRDCDGDGFGAVGAPPVSGCAPPGAPEDCGGAATATWSPTATDCDDACATCFPGGGPEICDGRDQNCDGTADEGVPDSAKTTYYRDADGDGVGDSSMVVLACVAPPGFSPVGGDCDDTESATRACAPPGRCLPERICGCYARLLNNAELLDLDTGAVSTTASAGQDLRVDQGSLARMFLVARTGVTWRRYEGRSYATITIADAMALAGTGPDPLEWVPGPTGTVYVVRSNSGAFYKLGHLSVPGTGRVGFAYEPLGTPPASFACPM